MPSKQLMSWYTHWNHNLVAFCIVFQQYLHFGRLNASNIPLRMHAEWCSVSPCLESESSSHCSHSCICCNHGSIIEMWFSPQKIRRFYGNAANSPLFERKRVNTLSELRVSIFVRLYVCIADLCVSGTTHRRNKNNNQARRRRRRTKANIAYSIQHALHREMLITYTVYTHCTLWQRTHSIVIRLMSMRPNLMFQRAAISSENFRR